jgi:3-keto-5-aminohexanoate cleavage enzyme
MLSIADFSEMKKLVITVAITGGIHGKEANPHLPEQPDEQAQDAYNCYNAGASICHLHVRDRVGKTTGDLRRYEEAISKIKAKCPMLVQVGNGIGFVYDEEKGKNVNFAYEERMKLLEIEPKPDLITINAGTFEFQDVLFPNSYEFNTQFVKRANERKIPIECEVYDIGHIPNIMRLVDEGTLKKPAHFSFVMGVQGGIPARHEDLMRMLADIPEGSTWQSIAIGKHQFPLTIAAMCMGGNVRTGLEDNVYFRRGKLALSNAQLVEILTKVARELGREIATVDEAKEYFGVGG